MTTLKEQLSKQVAAYDLWAQRRRYGPDGHNNRSLWVLACMENSYRDYPPFRSGALRLIGALLAEHHEAWQKRKYLDMGAYHEWKAAASERFGARVIALAG